MNRIAFAVAFAIGLMTVAWVGTGFVGSSGLALAITALIAGVYLLGAFELQQFRASTTSLAGALAQVPQPLADVGAWLRGVPAGLQNPVRLRIEGERVALPGPVLTPYLVGLLVMLGMLGTFVGMVITFQGAVFALEGSADLQAIRSALAAPIKGLGLSFGTSVAGVAASAMLGLLSALSRRERLEVARLLDTRIATVFRPFSLGHQRQEAFKALQVQAHALPDVVGRLQALADGLEQRNQQLNDQLLVRQAQFHREVGVAYADLAASVGNTLKDSLAASAKAAGESIQPVVEAAMAEIAQESLRTHQRQVDAAQIQLNGLSTAFSETARTVSAGWTSALQTHASTSESLVTGLDRSLSALAQTLEQRASALMADAGRVLSRQQAEQGEADGQRLAVWTQQLQAMAASLQGDWQRAGTLAIDRQQAACLAMEQAAIDITQRTGAQAGQTLDTMGQLLDSSQALLESRMQSEATWTQQQRERMDQLADLWRTELAALRREEAVRGQAAVDRLGALQTALTHHMATLGTALEAPMTRVLQTASAVPQAAAEVIVQLREEMTRLTERDNQAHQERTTLMAQINALLETIQQTSNAQKTAMASLAESAAAAVDQAGTQAAQALQVQAARAADVAVQVGGSAIELASLGESFHHGVQLFSTSNDKLMDSLQRMEEAIRQSMVRSDEQLAYYVAQAREVIDLSITSQQKIVEDLRQLPARQTVPAGEPH